MPLTLCQLRKARSKKRGACNPVKSAIPDRRFVSNVEIVKTYIDGATTHNIDEGFSVVAPNAILIFKSPEEKVEYTARQFKEEASLLYASFPDFTVTFGAIVETSHDTVVVENWQASGTHTGAPYTFGPYPAIEAKEIYCKNDVEKFTFLCKEGLIHRIEIEAHGPKTGLAGLYQQIGGLII